MSSIQSVQSASTLSPLRPSAATSPAGDVIASGDGFAATLRSALGEVSRLQHDATHAVENLAVGDTDDVTGVMTAVEKSEMAFKTLLAVRSKLMAAYDEIRNMPV